MLKAYFFKCLFVGALPMEVLKVWGQISLIKNESSEKDSQMYFVIYI